jgi:hypothetical protein
LEGYFHVKVKNNALSIKNGRATPKRYLMGRMSRHIDIRRLRRHQASIEEGTTIVVPTSLKKA